MKPGAYLVNVSRGSMVDENAVADSLARGYLAGYAADTFEMEDWARPRATVRLPSHRACSRMRDKTLFTPHLGSVVHAHPPGNRNEAAARNIQQALLGYLPAGAINVVS